MSTSHRRRISRGLLGTLLSLAACTGLKEDIGELRRFLASSELRPRTFDYNAVGQNEAFEVRGAIQDDLRYKMVLSSDGRELVQYVVQDDALAIRLVDPKFGARLANVLGHPTVDAALKDGRWVVDPSGASPLFKSDDFKLGQATDPFNDSRVGLLTVEQHMSEARQVKEFTLEDIEYRPQYDPWRYPDVEEDEKRYDLLRPVLPKTEGQASFGSGEQVTPAQFRKASVFVRGGRVRSVCTMVDVQGHEEILRLREEGLGSNRYLARVLQQIERKETSVPIEQRTTILHVEYPEEIAIDLPSKAVIGQLETFTAALQQAVTAGVLKPQRQEQITDCLRTQTAS